MSLIVLKTLDSINNDIYHATIYPKTHIGRHDLHKMLYYTYVSPCILLHLCGPKCGPKCGPQCGPGCGRNVVPNVVLNVVPNVVQEHEENII